MTNQFTSSHRLVLAILGLSIVTMIASVIFLPGIATPMIAILICAVLWLLRPLILPPGAGATKVRVLSLLGIFSLAGSHSLWGDIVNTLAKALSSDPQILRAAPWIAQVELVTEPSITVLMFAAISVLIVNYFMVDKTIGGGHPVPLNKDFPEPSFKVKLNSFCSALRQHLETTDRQTNWSPDYYTELEAEVEIIPIGGTSGKKRIVNLQTALRSERRTQAFLVLGDPGGGKSVALRKLARDMLAEVNSTGRIPLYINLREWLPAGGRRAAAWTEQTPPTIKDLEAFVLENIKARGDVFTEEFVDAHFRDLWQHGRLFFIFDSFDEIPELLDVNEESWLIDCLSDLLSRFISTNINARGVLASRMFRRPTQAFLAQKILDIRPMSEERIVMALARYPKFTAELQFQLFRDRHDLVPIARNPFLMALLGEWVNNHCALPLNQGDLYQDYLINRLNKVEARIFKHGLTVHDILNSATQIAGFVFNSPAYGLEAPVSVLKGEQSINHADAAIDVLHYARIARVTTGDAISFAFVHRRFLEYLVTTSLLATPDNLPIEHIPSDSRGRDAMVLYAQLCNDETAQRLAQLCWREICEHFDNPISRLRAIHSLRFLTDAFRARREAIAPFAQELESFIGMHIKETDGLIQAKICLEATGLLADTAARPILQSAMSGKNSWLRETAFRACRHLPKISPELQELINSYVINMPARQFWDNRRALIFSLALSDSLRETHRIATWRKRNLVVSICALTVGIIIYPFLGILVSVWAATPSIIENLFSPTIKRVEKILRLKHQISTDRQPVSQGTFFRIYQHIFGLFILLVASARIVKVKPSALHEATMTWMLTPFQLANSELISGIMIIIGLLSWDWLLIRFIGSSLKEFFELSFSSRFKLILSIIFAAVLIGAATVGLIWIEKNLSEWMRRLILIIVAIPILIPLSISSILEAYDYLREWLIIREIAITSRMSRQEIANILDQLKWPRLRLTIIRRLAERKTEATGNWPDDFKLSVSGDQAITELAKLEERWLKLDR